MKRLTWISVFTLFLGCAGNLYIRHLAVKVVTGHAPLIITVPHDGYLVPNGVPIRSDTSDCELVLKNDLNTRKLADRISDLYFNKTGQKPTLILNNIHRKYADMNRSEDCSAEHPLTRKFSKKYRKSIEKEINRLSNSKQKFLHIDLHGHASDSSDIVISTREHTSIANLYKKYGDSFFYGDEGIITMLVEKGYSVKLNDPFTGGHTIYFVPMLNPDRISSIQLEIHSRFRHDAEKIGKIAEDLMEVILEVERMIKIQSLSNKTNPHQQ